MNTRFDETQRLSRIYNLLYLSSPELIEQLHVAFPNQIVVAANILATCELDRYIATITSDSTKKYDFPLDLNTTNYQSKGNWIWITQLDISCNNDLLLSCRINKRVIDIPYYGKRICARGLLKNFHPELCDLLTKELQTEILGTKNTK